MSFLSSKDKPFAIIHPDAPLTIEKNLERKGFVVLRIPHTDRVDHRLSGHPDLQIFGALGKCFVHSDLPAPFSETISRRCDVIRCETPLGEKYPKDCPYNIVFTGKYALCKRKILPKEIISFFENKNIEIIDLPQGYARCTTMIVNESSIITGDEGIMKSVSSARIDVLLIREGTVPLKGFSHGFIGGATGSYRDSIYLTGTITEHPDYRRMLSFVGERGKEFVACADERAQDFGSILFI